MTSTSPLCPVLPSALVAETRTVLGTVAAVTVIESHARSATPSMKSAGSSSFPRPLSPPTVAPDALSVTGKRSAVPTAPNEVIVRPLASTAVTVQPSGTACPFTTSAVMATTKWSKASASAKSSPDAANAPASSTDTTRTRYWSPGARPVVSQGKVPASWFSDWAAWIGSQVAPLSCEYSSLTLSPSAHCKP